MDTADQVEENKKDDDQTTDKKPAQKHGDQGPAGFRDSPISHDPKVLAEGQRRKYLQDHISVHCAQRAGRVLLLSWFGMLAENTKMSKIFFDTGVTLIDGSTL